MTECSQPGFPQDSLSYTAMPSDGVFLVIPGLMAAEAVTSTPVAVTSISKFLSRSESIVDASLGVSCSLEYVVARWFNTRSGSEPGVSRDERAVSVDPRVVDPAVVDPTVVYPAATEPAAARLGYQMEISAVTEPIEVFRADPVYQQMDINHALLADQSVLNLTAEESQALLSTLNEQFAADGLVFECAHPERWYCRFDRALPINTIPLSSAIGRDVAQCRPTGPESRRWRSLLAEIEMILFAHPVNEQRQQRGELPINSLWLWGGGGSLPAKRQISATIYTGNFFTDSLTRHCDLQVQPVSEFSVSPSSILLVEDRMAKAAATADGALRVEVLEQLGVDVFSKLARLNSVFRHRSVALWCGGNKIWHLQRPGPRQWLAAFSPPKPFDSIVQSQQVAENHLLETRAPK